jgi:hypothetical protein
MKSTVIRVVARIIGAGIGIAIFCWGIWVYRSFADDGSAASGFVSAFPLWFVGLFGMLGALVPRRKDNAM